MLAARNIMGASYGLRKVNDIGYHAAGKVITDEELAEIERTHPIVRQGGGRGNVIQCAYARTRRSIAISGGAAIRTGTVMVPMPLVTKPMVRRASSRWN